VKTLVLLSTLLLVSPALAAPKCDSYSYCVGSETRIWEETYTAAFVFFTEVRDYDDNTAAGLAEGVADRALKVYKTRHSR
jgi:hypothetical protein